MEHDPRADGTFILSAFDREQWCPVLQARCRIEDLNELKSILAEQAADDPDLAHIYQLDDDELIVVGDRFGLSLDPMIFRNQRPDVFLFRQHSTSTAPYLIHTGYELPLLLDSRKKLARLGNCYPPHRFEGEDRFDRWVSEGVLSKRIFEMPFDHPVRAGDGYREVYYTPLGEEWRVYAMRLIYEASGASGGWNEHFERLEGMLFGYTPAEVDWWIGTGIGGGGFGGVSLCCIVDAEEMAWIEAAGFRALPRPRGPARTIDSWPRGTADVSRALAEAEPSAVALVRFNVLGRDLLDVVDRRESRPWDVPSDRWPDLNRHIRGLIAVVARRSAPNF